MFIIHILINTDIEICKLKLCIVVEIIVFAICIKFAQLIGGSLKFGVLRHVLEDSVITRKL